MRRVELLEADENAAWQKVAEYLLQADGSVGLLVYKAEAKELLEEEAKAGIWFASAKRKVTLKDGALFLDAVLASTQNSSYWTSKEVK